MGAIRRVKFRSGQLSLEGILHEPETLAAKLTPEEVDEGQTAVKAAVVCHPHPLYGGSMHNNVVEAICGELVRRGWTALRFNFRGVGGSQGAYGGAERARDDAEAALAFLADELPASRSLATIGYSFGAWAALAAGAADPRVGALAAISPAIAHSDFGFLRECHKAKLVVYGTSDEYVGEAAVAELLATLPEPKERRAFAGVDHFWWRHEPEMAVAVVDFLDRYTGR